MTANMWIASVAWALLMLGYLLRRKRRVHIPLVLAGILTDITLVLYLQITREAIQTALEFSLNGWQQTHIFFSSCALVLYFPVLFLGFCLILGRNTAAVRLWHVRLASSALVVRTLGFCFMFSMWKT